MNGYTDLPVDNLGPVAMRALHSHVVDSAYNQPDEQVGAVILHFAGGGTFRAFLDALDAQVLCRCVTILWRERGRVFLRVEVREPYPDSEWHAVITIPCRALGIDEQAFGPVVIAEAELRGLAEYDYTHIADRLTELDNL